MFEEKEEKITPKRFMYRLFNSRRGIDDSIEGNESNHPNKVTHKGKEYEIDKVYDYSFDVTYKEIKPCKTNILKI